MSLGLGMSFDKFKDKMNPKLRSAEERRAEFVKFFPKRKETIINYAASRISEEDEKIILDMAALYGDPADPAIINNADKEWLANEIFVVYKNDTSARYHHVRLFVDACYSSCVDFMDNKITREEAAQYIWSSYNAFFPNSGGDTTMNHYLAYLADIAWTIIALKKIPDIILKPAQELHTYHPRFNAASTGTTVPASLNLPGVLIAPLRGDPRPVSPSTPEEHGHARFWSSFANIFGNTHDNYTGPPGLHRPSTVPESALPIPFEASFASVAGTGVGYDRTAIDSQGPWNPSAAQHVHPNSQLYGLEGVVRLHMRPFVPPKPMANSKYIAPIDPNDEKYLRAFFSINQTLEAASLGPSGNEVKIIGQCLHTGSGKVIAVTGGGTKYIILGAQAETWAGRSSSGGFEESVNIPQPWIDYCFEAAKAAIQFDKERSKHFMNMALWQVRVYRNFFENSNWSGYHGQVYTALKNICYTSQVPESMSRFAICGTPAPGVPAPPIAIFSRPYFHGLKAESARISVDLRKNNDGTLRNPGDQAKIRMGSPGCFETSQYQPGQGEHAHDVQRAYEKWQTANRSGRTTCFELQEFKEAVLEYSGKMLTENAAMLLDEKGYYVNEEGAVAYKGNDEVYPDIVFETATKFTASPKGERYLQDLADVKTAKHFMLPHPQFGIGSQVIRQWREEPTPEEEARKLQESPMGRLNSFINNNFTLNIEKEENINIARDWKTAVLENEINFITESPSFYAMHVVALIMQSVYEMGKATLGLGVTRQAQINQAQYYLDNAKHVFGNYLAAGKISTIDTVSVEGGTTTVNVGTEQSPEMRTVELPDIISWSEEKQIRNFIAEAEKYIEFKEIAYLKRVTEADTDKLKVMVDSIVDNLDDYHETRKIELEQVGRDVAAGKLGDLNQESKAVVFANQASEMDKEVAIARDKYIKDSEIEIKKADAAIARKNAAKQRLIDLMVPIETIEKIESDAAEQTSANSLAGHFDYTPFEGLRGYKVYYDPKLDPKEHNDE